jgi:hypothetical protein
MSAGQNELKPTPVWIGDATVVAQFWLPPHADAFEELLIVVES